MVVTTRFLLAAVILCSVPGGVLLKQVCRAGCDFDSEEVSCIWANLTSVPINMPGNVRVLKLIFNRLLILRNDELLNSGYAMIMELYLPLNNILKLEDRAFTGITNLSIVNLDHNKITVFSKDILKGNLKLVELSLAANPLTMPSSDSVPLLNSASLTKLSFFYCNSTGLSEGWFSETPNITELTFGLNTWATLQWFAENHAEFKEAAEGKYNVSLLVECQRHNVLELRELGDEPSTEPSTELPYSDPVNTPDLWNDTVTCGCCLSLANYAIEKSAWESKAACRSEAGIVWDLRVPRDLGFEKQCYNTYRAGFSATPSN